MNIYGVNPLVSITHADVILVVTFSYPIHKNRPLQSRLFQPFHDKLLGGISLDNRITVIITRPFTWNEAFDACSDGTVDECELDIG